MCAHCYQGIAAPCSFQLTEVGNICMYTNTHVRTHTHIAIPLPVYTENQEFIVIPTILIYYHKFILGFLLPIFLPPL